MTTTDKAHPPKDQLIAFGQGKLAADESSSVEQHLEVCRECCETLLDLKDDTFVGLVRLSKTEDAVAEAASIRTDPGADANCVGHDSAHSATLLVQTGEAVSVDELPAELREHPRYRIVELIGRGGMGNVYRAEHRLMNRPVAIKLINSQLIRQPQAVERFRREVQAAAKLTHPNIVTAYDAEQAGNVHFLVMEFVEGTDLASVVKHRGPMSVAEACACIRQAAEGLQHAHEKGMVHRDIKPHNLMLSAEGQVRILDFGLAGFVTESAIEGSHVRQNVGDTHIAPQSGDSGYDAPPSGDGGYEVTAAHLTMAGSVMGTPDYIAPEQAKDAHSADIRADIYSLGCTLHFLLTGKPPFVSDNLIAKLKAHAELVPESLTKLRSDVPQELSNIVARMMAKKPAERFQTPAAVAEALAPFAKPAASPPRRRVRTMVAALCMGVAALLAGVIFVQTSKGRVEILSEVDDVEVVIKQGGEQIDFFDATTGSQVKWLPSGEYEIKLKGNRNDVEIEGNIFKLSRWGKVIVSLKRKPDANGLALNSEWKGWTKDAPPPAIAPFDGEQAKRHQEAWAKHLGVPVEYTNSIGMKFVLIPPGEFMMGSTPTQIEEAILLAGADEYVKEHTRSEAPQHRVILTQPIYLGIHEVTQGAYEKVMGTNPSFFVATRPGGKEAVIGLDTSTFPVDEVNWSEAAEFCTKLSEKKRLQPFKVLAGTDEGNGYRIPTEAQWEFACKAGTTTKYWSGDTDDQLRQAAWIGSNAGGRTHAVGELKSNPLGLYDIHGNVWEWVRDGWGPEYYAEFVAKPAIDPTCPFTDRFQRVLRGGNWLSAPAGCRASYRHADAPTIRDWGLGFRVSLPVDAVKAAIARRTIPVTTNRFVRDQKAAEWLVRIGGMLRVDIEGVERHVAKADEIPSGDWQVTEISVYPARFNNTAMLDKLAGLKSLRWLRLFNTQISDDGFKQLTDVPKLTFLDLDYNVATTDASLAHMAQHLSSVTDLGLHGTSITDDGLVHLGQLKHLKSLNLTATKINGAGLAHLAALDSLHYLILNATSIKDESLKHLANLPSLENLELLKTGISDAGVEYLVHLTKLKRLVIRETKISSAGFEQLKAALPNATIEAFTAEQQREQWQRLVEFAAWTPLEPTKLAANDGTTLRRLDDASLLAEGPNPAQSIYAIVAKTPLKRITALRLDVIRDDKLPSKGPGRIDNGTFVLTGVEVRTSPAPGAPELLLNLSRAIADYSQPSHDVSRIPEGQGSWAIWRDANPMQNQSLVLDLAEPLAIREGSTISVTLRHESIWPGANLGRFQLSATDDNRAPVEKPNKTASDSKQSPLDTLRDLTAVTAYLNNPRNNTGGSVPVALLGREGRVAFRFGNWLVVFEGVACDPKAGILGFSNFNVPQPGTSGEGTLDFGAGEKLPGVLIKYKFADEQNEISINNHRFKLRGKATRLDFGDKAYDVTNSLQTILVARDGSTKLEPRKNADDKPEATQGVSQNLITDSSFENTGLTQLPRDWRAWTNENSDFRCEVVNGGHTGQRSLRISGKGIRGVVFGNDIKADRSKRYALKGWAKFEGDKDARAVIKFNYFRGSEFLGVHDLVGVTADQPGWQLFEKTDALDAYPQADHFYAMCHVEGSGTGWFDDLEVIAYDRDKLPADFDSRHGRHNRLTGPNSLDRWVGVWETQYGFRETDNSPKETKLTMHTTAERTLGDYFLMSHAKATVGDEERLLILTFDQNLGAFRQWFFSSNGKSFEWRGQWDDAVKSLELRMLPDASNLFSTERFVDAEHIEASAKQQFVMGTKDAGRWTATRKAAAAKVDVPAVKTPVAEPAEFALLNKHAGDWSIRATYKPSVWNPQQREETITETSRWILGGHFLMTRAFNEKAELTSIWIATYEPLEKTNHAWFFNADGSSGQWRVTWDEASHGFHWRAIDMPTGWSGTAVNHLIDDDTFDNQATIKDETGRVMLDMTQDKRRKK